MSIKKWLHAGITATLLMSTVASGLAAYRYRDRLVSTKLVNREQAASLKAAQDEKATATRQLKQLNTWAPGIVRSHTLKTEGRAPREEARNYVPTDSYMGLRPQSREDRGTLRFDEHDLPTVKYGETFHYNPVTLAQFALGEYNGDRGPTPQFMVAVNKLLSMQSPDGAFRYDFPFTRYTTGEIYEPGWSSGMAQGQALSVLARAYALNADERLIEAGNRALAHMMRPYENGGTATTLAHFPPERSNAPFIMEYPQDPPVYTLNGYMFSILGLFDWAAVTGNADAKRHASEAVETLKILLPYYDLGVVSAYDLSFITIPSLRNGSRRTPHVVNRYHTIHIELLWALHRLTGEPVLSEFADRWLSYAGD